MTRRTSYLSSCWRIKRLAVCGVLDDERYLFVFCLDTQYARKVGINDLHPHAFRHFFATQLVEQGISLHIIKELLGHADISTTAVYLDILPKHLEAAVLALPDLTQDGGKP